MNLHDSELRTALRAACWAGHLACVKLLLEAGAELNHEDSEGRTALIAACYMGHTPCVRCGYCVVTECIMYHISGS